MPLNFASSFNVMKHNFLAETLYISRAKRVHESKIFQAFESPREISPNLYFDSLLLLKVHKIQLKSYKVFMSHDTEN